jgi:hypothetical protein
VDAKGTAYGRVLRDREVALPVEGECIATVGDQSLLPLVRIILADECLNKLGAIFKDWREIIGL